jgi:hypothetical protein
MGDGMPETSAVIKSTGSVTGTFYFWHIEHYDILERTASMTATAAKAVAPARAAMPI